MFDAAPGAMAVPLLLVATAGFALVDDVPCAVGLAGGVFAELPVGDAMTLGAMLVVDELLLVLPVGEVDPETLEVAASGTASFVVGGAASPTALGPLFEIFGGSALGPPTCLTGGPSTVASPTALTPPFEIFGGSALSPPTGAMTAPGAELGPLAMPFGEVDPGVVAGPVCLGSSATGAGTGPPTLGGEVPALFVGVAMTVVGGTTGLTTFGASGVVTGALGFPITVVAGGRTGPTVVGGLISITLLGVPTTAVGGFTGPTVFGGIAT
jgi:hypothetical protein